MWSQALHQVRLADDSRQYNGNAPFSITHVLAALSDARLIPAGIYSAPCDPHLLEC